MRRRRSSSRMASLGLAGGVWLVFDFGHRVIVIFHVVARPRAGMEGKERGNFPYVDVRLPCLDWRESIQPETPGLSWTNIGHGV